MGHISHMSVASWLRLQSEAPVAAVAGPVVMGLQQQQGEEMGQRTSGLQVALRGGPEGRICLFRACPWHASDNMVRGRSGAG